MTIFREKGHATIFIQNENPHLNKIAEGLNCVRYGQTSGLDVSGTVLSCSPFLHLGWTAEGTSHEVKTHLIGAYNLDNVLAAVAIGRYFRRGRYKNLSCTFFLCASEQSFTAGSDGIQYADCGCV